MREGSTAVALATGDHYASLRDAVWMRVATQESRMGWAAFEDAYQEVWAWIAGRESAGERVYADSGSPVAYLAQAVRRRYIDDLRAQSRGLARDEAAPILCALDETVRTTPGPEADEDAREARLAVSSIYLLARERLNRRELQAFALSYLLEMKPADAAQAMGVSSKRFSNLRWAGWQKVGDEVVSVIQGRLHWCTSEEASDLRGRALAGDPQALGPLRVHLADCATCSHSLASARREAAALLPLPLLLGEAATSAIRDLLAAAITRPVERVAELIAPSSGGGRGAAAALAVMVAVAGGAGVAIPNAETASVAPQPTVTGSDPKPERVVAARPAPERPVRARMPASRRIQRQRVRAAASRPKPQARMTRAPRFRAVPPRPSPGEFGFE